jgi:hypothetical protein
MINIIERKNKTLNVDDSFLAFMYFNVVCLLYNVHIWNAWQNIWDKKLLATYMQLLHATYAMLT